MFINTAHKYVKTLLKELLGQRLMPSATLQYCKRF